MSPRLTVALICLALAFPASAAAAANGPIVFESRFNVAVANLGGSGAAVVVQGESDEEDGDENESPPGDTVVNRFPAPMPGGRAVAYVRDATVYVPGSAQVRSHTSTIYVKRLGLPPKMVVAKGRRVFGATTTIQDLSVSPDGSHIAFAMEAGGGLDLFVVRTRGGRVRRLTHGGGDEITPAWAPNGRTIAYSQVAHPNPDELGHATAHIFTIAAADGSHRRRLTHGGAFDAHPSYSPDGRRIAFERRPYFTDNRPDPTRIWMMRRDGGGAHAAIHGTGRRAPAFSPDGRWIAYANYEKYEVEAVRLSDGATRRVAEGSNPNWLRRR